MDAYCNQCLIEDPSLSWRAGLTLQELREIDIAEIPEDPENVAMDQAMEALRESVLEDQGDGLNLVQKSVQVISSALVRSTLESDRTAPGNFSFENLDEIHGSFLLGNLHEKCGNFSFQNLGEIYGSFFSENLHEN